MKLVVGLGNPEKKYDKSRHNVGFETVDKFADSLSCTINKSDFKGLYCKGKYFNEDIYFLKPQTYMNLSGESVQPLAHYFGIEPEDIFVIHDDMDFEPGNFKLKQDGSSAGHNGIKSIINCLGTEKFNRIRIGIGKPTYDSIDFVLGKPNVEEKALIDKAEERAIECLKYCFKNGVQKAMSIYNSKGEKPID